MLSQGLVQSLDAITFNCLIVHLIFELYRGEKYRFLPYANNKGADQTVHSHSLICTFVICYTCKAWMILRLHLSLDSWTGWFES